MPAAPIRIACCINESYVLPLAVMVSSLAGRLDPSCRLTVHLLHQDLREESLAALASIVDLCPVPLPAQMLAGLPCDRRFPPEAAAPLLLADVLPCAVERVIFIDADVLALADVGALWRHDMRGMPIAAVRDPAIPRCSSWRGVKDWSARGIPRQKAYFNAGVMLIDLHAWRERRISERAIEYMREAGPRGDFFHQEALNAAASDEWHELPERWNVPSTAGRSFDRTGADAISDPGLVHFSGRMKPWRARTGSRFDAEYRRAMARLGSRIARPGSSLSDRLCGLYDRTTRPLCYPLERALWTLRII
jgi:lipopolysaccharide biosynthesis glycosyltransferase